MKKKYEQISNHEECLERALKILPNSKSFLIYSFDDEGMQEIAALDFGELRIIQHFVNKRIQDFTLPENESVN